MSNYEIVSLLEERMGDMENVLSLGVEAREKAMSDRPDLGSTVFQRQGNVAVIPVRGVLMPEWYSRGPLWGATGYNYIRSAVAQAGADSNVRAILLDMNSPGGIVSDMMETGEVIERNGLAKTGKPITAVIRGLGASACYALACNADHICASPSAVVGSIGAKLTHVSVQNAMARSGVVITEFTSHPGKADTGPYRDLSDDAKARLQASVDDAAEGFVQLVARRRRLSAQAVHALNAETFPVQSATGRKTALQVGLIDSVGFADDMIAELLRQTHG